MIDFSPDGFTLPGSRPRERSGELPPGIYDGGLDRPMLIDTGYTLLLATNSGKAVIPPGAIRRLVSDTAELSITVSEFSTVEFSQDNRKYLVVMRDGDRCMVIAR